MSKTCDTMLIFIVALSFALSLWTFLKVKNLDITDLVPKKLPVREEFDNNNNTYRNFPSGGEVRIGTYREIPITSGDSQEYVESGAKYSACTSKSAYQQEEDELRPLARNGMSYTQEDPLQTRGVKNQNVTNRVRVETSARDRDARESEGCVTAQYPQYVLGYDKLGSFK